MTAALLILAMAQSATGAPIAAAVSPEVLAAYRPAQLTIAGGGFVADCRVLIGTPGKLVPVRSRVISDSEIVVELTAGYGPNPARRQVVVACGAGGRSDPLWLTVEAEGGPPATDPTGDLVADGSPDSSSDDSPAEQPRVLSLDPGTLGVAPGVQRRDLGGRVLIEAMETD